MIENTFSSGSGHSILSNEGTLTNDTGAQILNSGHNTEFTNSGTLNNLSGGQITNTGTAALTNSGSFNNSARKSITRALAR